MCCVLGDEEVDEQIRLRDDKIFEFKQRITDLEHRNKELEKLLIKKDGMSIPTIATTCLLNACVHIIIICVCVCVCAYRR